MSLITNETTLFDLLVAQAHSRPAPERSTPCYDGCEDLVSTLRCHRPQAVPPDLTRPAEAMLLSGRLTRPRAARGQQGRASLLDAFWWSVSTFPPTALTLNGANDRLLRLLDLERDGLVETSTRRGRTTLRTTAAGEAELGCVTELHRNQAM